MGDKTVSVRVRFEGGDQVKAGLAEVGREGTRAMQQIGSVSKQTGANLQNAGYQVSDFFVQVAGGTQPSRALAQQLPQLLQGFGLIGVAASVLVAALPSLWAMFSSGEESSQDLDKSLAKLSDDLDAYQAYAKVAATSTAELAKQFGGFSGQIREFADYLQGVALAQTFDDLKGTVAALNAPLAAVQQQFSNIAMMKQQIAKIPLDDANGILMAKEAMGVFEDQLASAAAQLGIMPEQARELAVAIENIGNADSPNEIASAAAAALEVIKQIAPAGEALPAPLRAAAIALNAMATEAADAATNLGDATIAAVQLASVDMGGNIAGATTEAYNLAAALGIALEKAMAIAGVAPAGARVGFGLPGAANPRLGNGPGLGFGSNPGFDGQLDANGNIYTPPGRVVSGRGGGGGGAVDTDLARAKALTEGVRTETEKYAIALAEVDRLKSKGLITDETYNRQLDKLQDKLGELGDLGQKAAGAIRSAFDNLFDDPAAALKDLAKQLAMMALYRGLGQAFPSVFGGGGIIPLGVKGFAAGGMHGGGLRIVGENGPELEVTGPSMIYPNSALRGLSRGSGGAVSVQVFNTTGQPATAETRRGPNGEEMVRIMVGEEIARGGLDKPMRGRFAAVPQRLKR